MDSFYNAVECLRKNNFTLDCGYLTSATGKPILAIFDIREENKMTETNEDCNPSEAAIAIGCDIAKKRGFMKEENKMSDQQSPRPVSFLHELHERLVKVEKILMTEETKETKTETIDANNVESILLHVIKRMLNNEIKHETAQVILQGLSFLHLIRAEKEKNAKA